MWKGHLYFLFLEAERPYTYWHRSYLTNGKPKDGKKFLLDQQCYPLLELCMFGREFAQDEMIPRVLESRVYAEILNEFIKRKDRTTEFIHSDETPADDPAKLSYQLSSHILLWYTLRGLAKFLHKVGQPDEWDLENWATRLRESIFTHFVGNYHDRKIFHYECDGRGNTRRYHDSNDWPSLFARRWGFVKTESEVTIWKNTMQFAFSTANEEGYFDGGPFSGLGSVHTKLGPWPLGFAQQHMFAFETGYELTDMEAKIYGSMYSDGTFPEASNVQSGKCESRTYFSWSGCMVASTLLMSKFRATIVDQMA